MHGQTTDRTIPAAKQMWPGLGRDWKGRDGVCRLHVGYTFNANESWQRERILDTQCSSAKLKQLPGYYPRRAAGPLDIIVES
jgi:hypothetical protein